MDRLTPDQARQIHDALGSATGYLWRLSERMQRVGLDVRDPALFGLVTAALDTMHRLSVELHYRSCASGVGRPPTDGPVGEPAPHGRDPRSSPG
jgi:hypothetical protein